jgi:hypothetical protein
LCSECVVYVLLKIHRKVFSRKTVVFPVVIRYRCLILDVGSKISSHYFSALHGAVGLWLMSLSIFINGVGDLCVLWDG